jgi:hypothetical protein
MMGLRHRMRGRRDAARRAQALRSALRSVESRAVRNEIISMLGH